MIAQHRSALPGVEAMTLLTDHAFPRHSHDGFGIGVMDAGAQRSWSEIDWAARCSPWATLPGSVTDAGIPVTQAA